MKCPVCNVSLTMTERSGVEIDYCPQCRGVWLDRGELDKIIERSALRESPVEHRPRQSEERYQRPEKQGSYEKKRKRESFLGDLFDF
ncbi:TFIIB-type zinc ribbon-containing protein [Candidatus Desulforudis audaxviator]|uniref:Transcription factor zinc-finger domain-containing protein n=1 Tax=Desulforudis audaxviator (strain MP104C) TaxID=477974 RepID=B1I5Y1_DESAP|nr:zf-TFIIB domain-containing protein [Candidatus Desulforudis audaxviator]ACA60461.1 conserved hypothetical protein [Candidatus Desulforudis audaxviator MP104C]AZK60526.1 hypothetical protein Daudx_1995 [Candidatus Desulforudis audaxviator]